MNTKMSAGGGKVKTRRASPRLQTAEQLYAAIRKLSVDEYDKLVLLLAQDREIVEDVMIFSGVRRWLEMVCDEYGRSMTFARAVTAMLRQRSRQPAAATLQRNAHIHRLRGEDKRYWSWKRLAKQFDISVAVARKGFATHVKWLAEQEWLASIDGGGPEGRGVPTDPCKAKAHRPVRAAYQGGVRHSQ